MEKELLRSQEAKKVTILGFVVNALLTVCKILAGILGKSGAMLADGVHSLSDFLTDVVVLVGFKLTEQPEDECHNYGHDKYETLATAVISLFLGIVGFEILKSGVTNIGRAVQGEVLPTPGWIAFAAAAVSIATKEFLYRYTLVVGKKVNSSAITANAWHHRSDSFSSIGTLVGIGGAILLGEQWAILDPIASVIVSLLIFKVAFRILKPAVNELMESSLDEDEKDDIKGILIDDRDVKSFHKLRTRRIGTKVVIEFHMLVEDTMNVKDAHDIASQIEYCLKDRFGDSSIITIHIEPYRQKEKGSGQASRLEENRIEEEGAGKIEQKEEASRENG